MNAIRRTGLLALSLAAAAGAAGAQANKCDINEGSPFQINSAKIYLNKVQGGKEDEKESHLKNAVRVLTENPEKINNPLGRNWMLARALYEWTQRPDVGPGVFKKSRLGYASNPDQEVDILAALDTALTAVETAQPGCASRTLPLRKNTYVKLFNPAVELLNAGQNDTAAALIKRSLLIYRDSPNQYTALASIALASNDRAGAVANYRKAVELAGTDTAFAKMRRQSIYNASILLLQGAEEKEQAARGPEIAQARQLLESYLKEVPDDPNAKQALARAASLSGDTAAVANVYADMIKNPGKFTDIQLFEAGTAAARAGRNADAAALFEAGLAVNPYYRDALYNLSNVYFRTENAEKMLPVARRLTEVDPGNPDNWRLLAAVYQLQNKKTTNAAQKKAQTDSLIRFLERSEKLPVRVSISTFQHAGAKHTLTGSIENLGAAQASYTLKIEFLDKTGAPVATQSANVGPVAPKASADFSVSVNQPGIVAFRYAPLP